jgi:hypothetical protein
MLSKLIWKILASSKLKLGIIDLVVTLIDSAAMHRSL